MKLFAMLSIFSALQWELSAAKVIELSDRFLELKGDSAWVIMFYAPWCGHCKKLEPVWNHVSQELYNTDVRAGKVDCTRFTVLATHYSIRAFPTILFVKGNTHIFYRGDRTKDEIVGFGLRMFGDPIPRLDKVALKRKMSELGVFYLFVGDNEGSLWDCYSSLAQEYRHFLYVFSTDMDSMKLVASESSGQGVYVYKDQDFLLFSAPESVDWSNTSSLNSSLNDWMNNERFPFFSKITRGNIGQLWKINKYVVIFVLEENKVGKLEPTSPSEEPEDNLDYYAFKDTAKKVVENLRSKYNERFHFSWTGSPGIGNNLALKQLSLPAILVTEPGSMTFYEPLFSSAQLDEVNLGEFLDSILNGTAQAQGGDSYFARVYRSLFELKMSFQEIWAGNPVLTMVLIGLPFGFLSLLCYSIWCSDIMDADEEDETSAGVNGETHLKSD